MKTDLFLHGTSLDAAKQIIQHGFDATRGDLVWDVSEQRNYFFSIKKFLRYMDWNGVRENMENLVSEAFGQATATLAKHESPRRVVFLVDLMGIERERDLSCWGQEMESAIVTDEIITVDRIKKIWIDSFDVSCLIPFWKAGMIGRKFSMVEDCENPHFRALIDFFKQKTFYQDEEQNNRFEEISLDALAKF